MSEKPIREYDRFILRLPDGMRDKIQSRAKINKRSMNAEVLAALNYVYGGVSEMRALAAEAHRMKEEIEKTERSLAHMRERHQLISQELADKFGAEDTK